jgi:Uma2 family endonuclease
VRIQNPIRLSIEDEPEPDIAIVLYRPDFYSVRHPGPEEVLVVIEVCDSTLDYDREVKLPVYARAGVPEVWLVDVNSRSIGVYRRPTPDGYEESREARAGDLLVPDRLPGPVLAVDDILIGEAPETQSGNA